MGIINKPLGNTNNNNNTIGLIATHIDNYLIYGLSSSSVHQCIGCVRMRLCVQNKPLGSTNNNNNIIGLLQI